MEITGLVFVCFIFLVMLSVAGYCCLRVCSNEIPYKENVGSRKNSSVSSISISETLRSGSSVVRSNSPKTSAPAANGIKAQVHNIRPPKPSVPHIKVDDNQTAYSMVTSLYPPKQLPIEHQRSLDKLTIERETNRSRSRSRSACPSPSLTGEIKLETSTPKPVEQIEGHINLHSTNENQHEIPTPKLVEKIEQHILHSSASTKNTIHEPSHPLSSSSPMYRRKKRYSSEPPLPPPPTYAEAIANRRSLVEPPLPREYLI